MSEGDINMSVLKMFFLVVEETLLVPVYVLLRKLYPYLIGQLVAL